MSVTGAELDALERILEDHVGPDDAITSGELSDRLDVDDGEGNPATREGIRILCEERGLPVAAGPKGYYVLETEEQLDEYMETLEARKQGIEERMWLVRKAWRQSRGDDQMTLGRGSA